MSPKPSRHKETHYNRSAKPAGGSRKPVDKKEKGGPGRRSHGDEAGDQPVGRKKAGEGKAFGRPAAPRPERTDRDTDRKPPYRKSTDKDQREGTREKRPYGAGKPGRPYADRPATEDRKERPFRKATDRTDKPPYSKSDREEGTKRPYPGSRQEGGERPFSRKKDGAEEKRPVPRSRQEGGDRPYPRKREGTEEKRPFRETGGAPDGTGRKRIERREAPKQTGYHKRAHDKPSRDTKGGDRHAARPDKNQPAKRDFEDEDLYEDERPFLKSGKWNEQAKAGPMTLNKYLAHAGVSSRRETAAIVKEGKVKVNGQVVLEPGYRVQDNDVVMLDGKVMTPQKHLVYILLNKPKDFLTTTEDDRGRRTVMELVANAGADRLFPVGRLDRNTTGVLLLTNDGDLAQKLSHPSYEVKKIYQVTLDKDLTKKDFENILEGVELEDGPAKVDRLAYLEKKHEIGLEIHSGRNRIVRRIFESLGYSVEKLDRVMYAGLTKKNVTRGQWRFLSEKEVIHLKHFRNR